MSLVLHTPNPYHSARGNRPPRYCTVDGCGKPTNHSKPWCHDHVPTHSPAAAAVMAAQDGYAREIEWADLGVSRLVDVDGELAKDLMLGLVYDEFGRASVHKLAHRIGMTPEGACVVARKLARAGRLKFVGKNRRGYALVEAIDA